MTKAHEELVNFIAGGSTPEAVVKFKASKATRERVNFLIRKEKAEGLRTQEKRELNDYLQLEHLMRLAKAKALRVTVSE
jgi:hypothetical protein